MHNWRRHFTQRAKSLDVKRDWDQAIADYTQAIQFDPNSAPLTAIRRPITDARQVGQGH